MSDGRVIARAALGWIKYSFLAPKSVLMFFLDPVIVAANTDAKNSVDGTCTEIRRRLTNRSYQPL